MPAVSTVCDTTEVTSPRPSGSQCAPIVLLDLDGTLIDSLATVQQTLCLAADALGKERPSAEFLRSVAGPPMQVTMARLGWSPAEVDAGKRFYFDHYDIHMWDKSELFPGIADALAELRALGYELYLATSKREVVAFKTVAHVGIEKLFSGMVGAHNDGTTHQAKADVIAKAIRQAGDDPLCPRRRYVMVGDRIHDVEGAAVFGIDTILCTWGTGSAAEWGHATHTIDSVAELPQAVQELLPRE